MSAQMMSKYLNRNAEFAKNYKTPRTMAEIRSGAIASGESTVLVTCLDPRCVAEDFFGFDGGVIRNAGGRAAPALPDIVALHALVNLKNVVIIHHTDCGMSKITDAAIKKIEKEKAPEAAAEIDAMTYGSFSDFEGAIKQDVEFLQANKILKGVNVFGYAFNTETGVVTNVV